MSTDRRDPGHPFTTRDDERLSAATLASMLPNAPPEVIALMDPAGACADASCGELQPACTADQYTATLCAQAPCTIMSASSPPRTHDRASLDRASLDSASIDAFLLQCASCGA